MRYRALSPTGDYTFGQGSGNFLVNLPATVGQACLTRLKLMRGEWFLDNTVGMPYGTDVFVTGGRFTADRAAQAVILGTQGVKKLVSYSSSIDANRHWRVEAMIDTIYGQTPLSAIL